ncbi:protein MAIN-LIKE 1-like [Cajanus cajan]|uniref:protein MAIN-LIKE 1-like n=1 Tax=Cajanus cajan TaxID=3821 RepID=UPI0010FB6E1D|nr:protein MAIN-LIKE 1-like [Cajanus cajan]
MVYQSLAQHYMTGRKCAPPISESCQLKFLWAPYGVLQTAIPMQAYRDALLWTSCTSIICFAIVEWHQSDRVKLQFRLFQDVPSPPNNLDNLHNIDMRGRQDENWVTRHAQWIDIWNNRREHTLMGHPMQGPLFHTREYMEWYMANSIYFLSVPRLLQDPRTRQQRRTSITFETGGTSMRSHEETGQHVSNPQYVTPEQNIIDKRHSFGIGGQLPQSPCSYQDLVYAFIIKI